MMDIKTFYNSSRQHEDEIILNRYVSEINQNYHHIMQRMTPQIQENGIVPRKNHNLDKYMLSTVCFTQDAGIFNKRTLRQTLLTTWIITPKTIMLKFGVTPERILDQISKNLYLEKVKLQPGRTRSTKIMYVRKQETPMIFRRELKETEGQSAKRIKIAPAIQRRCKIFTINLILWHGIGKQIKINSDQYMKI